MTTKTVNRPIKPTANKESSKTAYLNNMAVQNNLTAFRVIKRNQK